MDVYFRACKRGYHGKPRASAEADDGILRLSEHRQRHSNAVQKIALGRPKGFRINPSAKGRQDAIGKDQIFHTAEAEQHRSL